MATSILAVGRHPVADMTIGNGRYSEMGRMTREIGRALRTGHTQSGQSVMQNIQAGIGLSVEEK